MFSGLTSVTKILLEISFYRVFLILSFMQGGWICKLHSVKKRYINFAFLRVWKA